MDEFECRWFFGDYPPIAVIEIPEYRINRDPISQGSIFASIPNCNTIFPVSWIKDKDGNWDTVEKIN